jgi:hypothetical protein
MWQRSASIVIIAALITVGMGRRLTNSLLFAPAAQWPRLPESGAGGEAAGGGSDVACVDAGPGEEFRAGS